MIWAVYKSNVDSCDEQRDTMQCNLIPYSMSSSAYRFANALGLQTTERNILHATGLNRHRRKAGHRQHLLQLAWRLQDHLTGPFVLQAVALA
jgi:hypothetical protein